MSIVAKRLWFENRIVRPILESLASVFVCPFAGHVSHLPDTFVILGCRRHGYGEFPAGNPHECCARGARELVCIDCRWMLTCAYLKIPLR